MVGFPATMVQATKVEQVDGDSMALLTKGAAQRSDAPVIHLPYTMFNSGVEVAGTLLRQCVLTLPGWCSCTLTLLPNI